MAGIHGENYRQVVERYGQAMNTNDWQSASDLLRGDFALDNPVAGL
ncbi:MAG TPA: hypothetical protein VF120_03560 [Ktedonobacterales bacterium]